MSPTTTTALRSEPSKKRAFLLGAGTATALVAAAAASLWGLTRPGSTAKPQASASTSGVVAWRDQPTTPPSPSPTVTSAAATVSLPCSVNQLTTRAGGGGANHGHEVQTLIITNTGAACALPQFAISGRNDQGLTKSLGLHGPTTGAVTLGAGVEKRFQIAAPLNCPGLTPEDAAAHANHTVTLDLPGKALTVNGVYVNDVCGGLEVSTVADPPAEVQPVGLALLNATVALPDAAKAGGTLNYTVTLSNPTDSALPFSSCPSYTELVGTGDSPPASTSYVLNCGGTALAAHASRVYAMQVRVPDGLAGLVKVTWAVQPDGPVAGGAVTVS